MTEVSGLQDPTNETRVDAVLDDFHAAASAADESRYFACLAPEAIFLGTAAGERWAGADFRQFVHSFFSQGKGWTYVPSSRTVSFGGEGRTAWFDEVLENDWFGQCRGTGVLRVHDDRWLIEQYSLSISIPDELAPEFVAKIRETQQT